MNECGAENTCGVILCEARKAELLLNHPTEHPQSEHIEREMKHATMEKRIRDRLPQLRVGQWP